MHNKIYEDHIGWNSNILLIYVFVFNYKKIYCYLSITQTPQMTILHAVMPSAILHFVSMLST